MILKELKTINSLYKGSKKIIKIYKGSNIIYNSSVLPS